MYLNAEMYISNAYKHSFISFSRQKQDILYTCINEMIDVIVICNESNCNQCFILCTFQIIIHNVLTNQKVH